MIATDTPTLTFDERLGDFAERLTLALGELPAIFPVALFADRSLDAHTWHRTTAKQVATTFEAWDYAPDLDVLLYGLVDFSVRATLALCETAPKAHHADIQTGMVDFAIQILAKTRASDGTKHASRSSGNRLRNLYLEGMRRQPM